MDRILYALQLHLITVTCQKVKLNSRQYCHDEHHYHRVRIDNRSCLSSGRDWWNTNTSLERDVSLRLRKHRHREEGKCPNINEKAGTNHQPLPKTTKILLTHDGKFATRHRRPDGCQYEHSSAEHHSRQNLIRRCRCMDEQRSRSDYSHCHYTADHDQVTVRLPRPDGAHQHDKEIRSDNCVHNIATLL